jgi:DNA-directed RNA polymerase specialized sigma24 family protein
MDPAEHVISTPVDPAAHMRLARSVAARWAAATGHDVEEAEGVALEALVRAARRYVPGRGSWAAFARVCMENALRMAARHERRQAHHQALSWDALRERYGDSADPGGLGADLAGAVEDRVAWAVVRQGLDRRDAQTVAELERAPDASAREHARQLGVSLVTWYRRLARLRRHLEEAEAWRCS